MNELIKITEQNGQQAVNARDLHCFLESKQDFSDWIKNRIEKYGFVENQDFEVFHNFMEKGRPRIEYALSIHCAKELAMVEGNERGKEARLYFIKCEEAYKKPFSQLDYLQQQLNFMKEQEKRLYIVENKVDAIIEKQNEAERELKLLPLSTEKVPEMALRDKVRLLVNKYATATGISQRSVWDNVYRKLYYLYHIHIKSYNKNKNESWLDIADRNGFTEKLYCIVSDLLVEKGIATAF